MGSENLDCEWMIDIVERLRKREFAARVVKDKHEIYRDAADTIWRAQGKIARLRAENEKLRAALKPFANAVLKDEYSWKYDINSDDFRVAAAAIRESGDE